jgi:hypothetical protein
MAKKILLPFLGLFFFPISCLGLIDFHFVFLFPSLPQVLWLFCDMDRFIWRPRSPERAKVRSSPSLWSFRLLLPKVCRSCPFWDFFFFSPFVWFDFEFAFLFPSFPQGRRTARHVSFTWDENGWFWYPGKHDAQWFRARCPFFAWPMVPQGSASDQLSQSPFFFFFFFFLSLFPWRVNEKFYFTRFSSLFLKQVLFPILLKFQSLTFFFFFSFFFFFFSLSSFSSSFLSPRS